VTVSKGAAISAAATPLATDALRTRAVEMHRKAELPADPDHRSDLLERPDPPARGVVGVLDRDDPRRRGVRAVTGSRRSLDFIGPEAARDAANRPRHQPCKDGGATELGKEDVAVLLGDQFVPGLG
jgi:hypothetical protein